MSNQTAEKRLTTQRAELLHQLAGFGASDSGDLREDVDFGEGFADAASATAERTEVLGLIESIKKSLMRSMPLYSESPTALMGGAHIVAREIGAAWLDHRPESVHCVDCQAAIPT